MPYAIHIPDSSLALMEELPRRTRACIHLTLSRIAEMAPHWPLDDLRWERLARRDSEGLHFYVDGCCIQLMLEAASKRVTVTEIGRILVHLPAELLGGEKALAASLVGH